MKVVGTNQFASARFTQPLPKELLADGWRNVGVRLRALLFDGAATALCALAVWLLSVLLIGGLDRLGVAPQDSFLGLNLTLIAGCLLLLFSPLTARIRHSRAMPEASAAGAAVKRIRAEPIGKLLIIRRKREFMRYSPFQSRAAERKKNSSRKAAKAQRTQVTLNEEPL